MEFTLIQLSKHLSYNVYMDLARNEEFPKKSSYFKKNYSSKKNSYLVALSSSWFVFLFQIARTNVTYLIP